MQRNEEALEQSAAALAIHEKVLGAPHQWTADSTQGLRIGTPSPWTRR
jgi:hypothetical protein